MADAEIIGVYAVKRKVESHAMYCTEGEKQPRARQRADPPPPGQKPQRG
jgi:hypothetical protein